MAEKLKPQIEAISPFYVKLSEMARPLLTGQKNGSDEEVQKIYEMFKNAPSVLFDSLKKIPAEQEKVTNAVIKKDERELVETLKDLYQTNFNNQTDPETGRPIKDPITGRTDFSSNYIDVLSTAYGVFKEKFGDRINDIPENFAQLTVQTLQTKVYEALRGESSELVLPTVGETKPVEKPVVEVKKSEEGTKEKKEVQAPPVSRPKKEDDANFVEWRNNWFKDRPDEDFSKWAFIQKEDLGKVNNLSDLRDVAIQRLRMMYMTNEVDEESFRRDFFDDLNTRAETLGVNASEKVKYIQNMVNAMRELQIYWLKGWMGETGGGVGVEMKSIATLAAKFGDSGQGYINFLIEQQAINAAMFTQTIQEGPRAHRELSGENENQSLWKIAGYRLRRMTGMAVYDGIDYLKEKDLDAIINLLQNTKNKDFEEVQQELANMVFGRENKMKPHSVDYQLFLNHSVPWYLTVRYREKFKQHVDFLYQTAEHLREEYKSSGMGEPPGLMTRKVYERLGKELESQFHLWNLGEVGAYSMWKRPDTSGTWLNNLKMITLVSELHNNGQSDKTTINTKIQQMEDAELVSLNQEVTTAKDNDARKKATDAVNDKKKYYDNLRSVFNSFEGRPEDFQEFIDKGLNFGMKMISLYDAKQDRRSSQNEINEWNQKFKTKTGFDVFDWTVDALQERKSTEKTKILQTFLNSDIVLDSKQHEIIRNNLIRTVRVDEKIRGKIGQKAHEAGLDAQALKIKSYTDIPIYQEFIDLDELYVSGKKEGDSGEAWLRFFDKRGFSHNAFVIYEGYASDTRVQLHKMFDRTTSISKWEDVKEALEGAKAFKHLVDTGMAVVSETGFKEYDHSTTWRIERTLDAIEEYKSSMMVLSIAMYRKLGVRHKLAVHVNDQVSQGVNESFFNKHHFEPAKSRREKALNVEANYHKYLEFARMNNDFKLRHIFNLCGFKLDKQREVWELGFLKKMNEGREEGMPPVSYDTLLLMAGLKERPMPGNDTDIRGYEIDEEIAGVWFDFYKHYRQEPSLALFESLRPGSATMFIERAKNALEFQGKDDSFIAQSLELQFKQLNKQFTNSLGGLFSGIPSYQRTIKFVYERVIDAYVENTFDKDRRIAFPEDGKKKWKKREWGPEVNFMRREQFKCQLIRERKFAIAGEDSPGFNKYIVTQVDASKNGNPGLFEQGDERNWIQHPDGTWEMKDLHGLDSIESWLLGSGEIDFGKGKRLTRLPNYFDKNGLMYLYMSIFSAETAKEMFIHSDKTNWENGLGGMIDYKGHHVLKGPWLGVITPKKMAEILDTLIDPGTYSVFDAAEIRTLKKKFGCTDIQVGKFERERQELGIMDLERGPNQALEAQEKEGAEALDAPMKFFLEFPAKALGSEVGAMLPGKKELSLTNSPKKYGIFVKNLVKFGVPALGLPLLIGPAGWLNLLVTVPTFVGVWRKSVQTDDLDPSWSVKGIGDLPKGLPEGLIKMRKPKITIAGKTIGGGFVFNSIYGEKVIHRSSYMLIEGPKPLYDDMAIAVKDAIKDVSDQKMELTDEQDTSKSGGGKH
jgi:hypothetical protein